MSKTLSTILTVFKVAKIVAKVLYILCIVGAVGSAIGLVATAAFGNVLPSDMLADEGLDALSASLSCLTGMITCAAEAVFFFLVERYCASVMSAGTPFTAGSADESFRLGIISIIISVASSVACGIAVAIFSIWRSDLSSFDVDVSVSLSTGLFFMFMSLIFKHGAELGNAARVEGEKEDSADGTDRI